MVTEGKDMELAVSTVTPVYAGADYIEELVGQLHALREKWITEGAPMRLAEAVFVDDAAIDDSPQLLDRLAEQYDWVRVIHLSRNFGQHPATIAGILHSSGDWVVTLDEDLQHRPADIDRLFVEVAKSSCDIVYAKPHSAVHEQATRDLGSRLYKKLVARLTNNPNVPHFNSFRLLRGSIARAAASVCSHDTYFDMSLCWFTNRIAVVTMNLKDNRVIEGGSSGYSFRRLLSHARRMAVTTHSKFLRGGAFIGLSALGVSVIYALVVLIQKLFVPASIPIQGWASLLLVMLFFGGLLSLLIGVLLEYTSVIVLHIQGKPAFFTVDRRSDRMLAQYFEDAGR